mmetsp:Transcript_44120/g.103677  ORF Transcript_44120/g.103677 Transcript_44120/m.103677 type:complete len:309 (-) Transcript_44120:67-993(-)
MGYGGCREANKGCGGTGGDPKCGFRTNHSIGVWSSPDLASGTWTYVSDALPVEHRPEGIYYRPRVIYNKANATFVLWVNLVPDGSQFGASRYVVATSKKPTGPFSVVRNGVAMPHTSPGDFALFVDDDEMAYIMYTSVNEGHNMSIVKLEPNYLDASAETSPFFGATFVEAPVLFKRQGTYYAFFGHCCCFCVEGSGVGVYTASTPLGPYTAQGNVGCDYSNKSIPTGPYGCEVDRGVSITHAQADVVITLSYGGNTTLLWKGDQWQSAKDRIKSHDLQYWTPLVFDDSVSPPKVGKLHWLDGFTVDV